MRVVPQRIMRDAEVARLPAPPAPSVFLKLQRRGAGIALCSLFGRWRMRLARGVSGHRTAVRIKTVLRMGGLECYHA